MVVDLHNSELTVLLLLVRVTCERPSGKRLPSQTDLKLNCPLMLPNAMGRSARVRFKTVSLA